MEKEILTIWKERIKKEVKHGDKARACEAAGVTTTTFLSALKRKKITDLKDKEIKVLQILIEMLDSRKQTIEKIQMQYAEG